MRKYINLSSFSHAKVRRHSMMFIDSLVHPGQELSHLLGLLGQLLNVPQVLAMISWVKENGLLLDESQSFVCVTLECVHCTGHGESCLVSLFVLVKALLQNGGLEMWWVFFCKIVSPEYPVEGQYTWPWFLLVWPQLLEPHCRPLCKDLPPSEQKQWQNNSRTMFELAWKIWSILSLSTPLVASLPVSSSILCRTMQCS